MLIPAGPSTAPAGRRADSRSPRPPSRCSTACGARWSASRSSAIGERAVEAWAEVVMKGSRGGSSRPPGFTFGTIDSSRWRPARATRSTRIRTTGTAPGRRRSSRGWCAGGRNTLYAVLAGEERPLPLWPEAGAEGQARFLAGLDALHAAGRCTTSSRASASSSAATAARRSCWCRGRPAPARATRPPSPSSPGCRARMAAGQDFRVFLSCKTHAATDVLLENVVEVQRAAARLGRHRTRAVRRLLRPAPAGRAALPRPAARRRA